MNWMANCQAWRRVGRAAVVVAVALGSGPALAQVTTTEPTTRSAPASRPARVEPPRTAESAVTPAPRPGNWMKRHDTLVANAKAKQDARLVFVGDSITDFWDSRPAFKPSFATHYGTYNALDLGVSGDATEHVLWRLANGEADGLSPKVVVLMIGTNNLGHGNGETPEWTAAGVKRIVGDLHQRMPDAKVLLLSIFPRGNKKDDPNRLRVAETNKILATFGDDKTVYLDISDKFLDAEGTLPKDVMPDFLHPSLKGYEIWAEAMRPTLEKLME